jgi:hypothetical protein
VKDNKWTIEEDKLLENLHIRQGMGWTECSIHFENRTPESLRMHWRNTRGETNLFSGLDKINPSTIGENMPRVGLFDIETLPAEAYVWGLRDVFIGQEQIITDTGFLCWAGKFLNEADIHYDVLTPKEALEKDDERITQSCWNFLYNCDVVVGHNLQNFDAKVANTFFLKYNLPPLQYKMVDTYLIVKRHFRFESNKMGYINRRLGIKEKIENEGFPLWRKCREGEQEALDKMLEYNIGDVYALEQLYYRVRPYIHTFNAALYNEIDTPQCPVCGSTDLKSEGFYRTPAGMYESLRCQNCKCISRAKENLLSKKKRKALRTVVAV